MHKRKRKPRPHIKLFLKTGDDVRVFSVNPRHWQVSEVSSFITVGQREGGITSNKRENRRHIYLGLPASR